jgi:guanine deaminase
MDHDQYMKIAVQQAREGVQRGEGGPFGAVITKTKTGEIVARSHNMVLQTNDPTAHAEITCIRKACAKLGRFDLSDCTINSSCEPCPMCYGAIHWAKITRCEYASTASDASKAGFDDGYIYRAIRGTLNKEEMLQCHFIHKPIDGANSVFTQEYDRY